MKAVETSGPEYWRSSTIIAIVAHLALLAALLFLPAMSLRPERGTEVLMVRLSGGGQNRPGWVKPTPAPPDEAKVPDNKPMKRAEPKPPAETPKTKEKPAAETKPLHTQTEKTSEKPVPETVNATPAPATQQSAEGEGVGAKPGPEGPGIGIISDADFPGADVFLSRIEAEVQRRFNYHGRGSGAMAEYHFFIDRRGKVRDLVLMVSSGISTLDLAARGAIIRAKFPPLPAGFRSDRLGVTFRFHDAD